MKSEVKIGKAESPTLVVSLLNFYFQLRGMEAVAGYREYLNIYRVFISFETEADAELFKLNYSDDYKEFVRVVFSYVMETFYKMADHKDLIGTIEKKQTVAELVENLLNNCIFGQEEND